MTREQCREARRLLGWTQNQLAEAADICLHAVGTFERIGREARRSGSHRRSAIRAALEDAGVIFTSGDAPGVRLRKQGE